ncbi:tetratricopeptide repeat-containing sensor histidine kinase [Corallibacter vietnamensis]|uniref:tetratricopeptide repeat-containing sensor histidine kinase n=1 Tax=Corallibacter vietnamensis TaxID=904130 RepID=UPI0031D1F137
MIKNILFILSFSLATALYSQNQIYDSIYHYRALAKDTNLDLDERILFAKKAIAFSNRSKKDSTLLTSKRLLSTLYLYKRDVNELYDLNHENLKLANSLNDSLAVANVSNVLGWVHSVRKEIDSSYYYYYKASKFFKGVNQVQNEAVALFNMADIQFNERDYIGCEKNAIESIKLFKTLDQNENTLDYLWALNNLIAIASDELELYDKAIEYHNKALSYSNRISDNYLYTLYSNSNIALIYKELKQYDKVLDIYDKLFEKKELLKQEPNNYALILGDYAYSKHLSGKYNNKEIKQMLTEANKVSDSVQDPFSIMSVSLNAANFYTNINKKDSALIYANQAYKTAVETKTNDVILRSLMLKSKIEDPSKAKDYLYDYVKLRDSLQTKERAIRNKFARIEFETDQIEQENLQISRERMWLMIISSILVITIILVYIIISQRAKNKELKFIQEQQETNEEIYNLMLSQHDKIEEARAAEKRRISEELHDGILGRLFGTRLSLDSLNFNTQPEAIQSRSTYINELKNIEHDIRKVSHDLNTDFISGSGYLDIIKTMVETQTKAYGLKYAISNKDDIQWDDVSNKTKIHIYRIIQEALQNIYKHANASDVKISFKLKNNVICLTIKDNGSGFDVDKAKKGIGLKNMNSRVKEIQGKLIVKSEKDLGSKIIIKAPI